LVFTEAYIFLDFYVYRDAPVSILSVISSRREESLTMCLCWFIDTPVFSFGICQFWQCRRIGFDWLLTSTGDVIYKLDSGAGFCCLKAHICITVDVCGNFR